MPRRIEVAPLLSASSLTIYGLFSFITMGCMIYKALHEQENALIASSWINNNNGCLAVSRMGADPDRGELYYCQPYYLWTNCSMYCSRHASSDGGGCEYPVRTNIRL